MPKLLSPSWLQDLRDYLAGRSIDLDAILTWAELQTSEIAEVPNCGVHDFPMIDEIPVGTHKSHVRRVWV